MNLPGWRLHSLQGKSAGHYSIVVSGNWRMTFRFEGEDAILVNYQDSLKKAQAEINAKRAAATALAKSGDKEKKYYDKQAKDLKEEAGYETTAATIAKTAGFVATQAGITTGELLTTSLGILATTASFVLANMAQDTLIRAGEKQLRGKEAQR